MHNYVEALVHVSFCSPSSILVIKMLPKFEFKRNPQESTGQRQQAHKAIVVQSNAANHPPTCVPVAKQPLKIRRKVAVLRAMTLHCWMLNHDMFWVSPVQMAHESYFKQQELTTDVDRWKTDPIQSDIWEGMVHAMQVAE